jgi:AraC-like DNA-binding protein
MSMLFKRHFGVTPRRYRLQARRGANGLAAGDARRV